MTTVKAIDFSDRPILERIVILAMVQQEWQLFPDLALYTQHLFHLFSQTFRNFKQFESIKFSENGRYFMKTIAQTENFNELLERLMERHQCKDQRVKLSETQRVLSLIADIMMLSLKYHPWTTINQLEAIKSLKICQFYLNAPSQQHFI